jgi:hypothetical protein
VLAQARGLRALASWATKAGFAIMPALGIMIVATWAMSSSATAMYLQALLWAGGFIFVALAVESEGGAGAVINLAIGLSMLVLAGLSVSHVPEFAVVASALPAARIAWAIVWG